MTWQDVNDPTKTATLSSAPSNSFHQILLTGGYNFSPTTKLVLNGSYGRNTQDDQFVTAGQNNQFPLGPAGVIAQWRGRDHGVQRQAHRQTGQGPQPRPPPTSTTTATTARRSTPISSRMRTKPGPRRLPPSTLRSACRRTRWAATSTSTPIGRTARRSTSSTSMPTTPSPRGRGSRAATSTSRSSASATARGSTAPTRRRPGKTRCGPNGAPTWSRTLSGRLAYAYSERRVELRRERFSGAGADGKRRPRRRSDNQCLSVPAADRADRLRPGRRLPELTAHRQRRDLLAQQQHPSAGALRQPQQHQRRGRHEEVQHGRPQSQQGARLGQLGCERQDSRCRAAWITTRTTTTTRSTASRTPKPGR